MNWLNNKKTYFIATAIIFYAIVVEGWQNGNWSLAVEMILGALGLGALRAGVQKSGK